ncbi:hypothetical protein CTI14_70805, partial [Methylobacterium radiotolerans]
RRLHVDQRPGDTARQRRFRGRPRSRRLRGGAHRALSTASIRRLHVDQRPGDTARQRRFRGRPRSRRLRGGAH